MDRTLAQSIVRIGKELAAALEQKSESGAIVGKQGLRLTNYSSDYILGLGVSLGILWECVNHKPLGSAHQLTLHEILGWVRDIQKAEEGRRSTLIQ